MWMPPSKEDLKKLEQMSRQLCKEFPEIDYKTMYDMVYDGFWGCYAFTLSQWRVILKQKLSQQSKQD